MSLVMLSLVTLVMLRLFLTKMLVTMTALLVTNSELITKKLGENITIKVLIFRWQKWQNPAFLTKFLKKSVFFDKRKMTFLAAKSLSSGISRVVFIL